MTLLRSHKNPFIQVIDEAVQQYWAQYWALGHTTSDRLPVRPCTIDHSSNPSGMCCSAGSPAASQSTSPGHTPCDSIVRGNVKSLAKIKPDDVPCSSLNPYRQLFVEIAEGNQVGQAWFTFSEFMLTHPDHLPVIHVDRDVLQNEVILHLSKDGSEADWMIVVPSPSCPFWRLGWYLLFSNPQAPLLVSMTFQRWLWVALQCVCQHFQHWWMHPVSDATRVFKWCWEQS